MFLVSATFDSGVDYEELYVEPNTQSRLRTEISKWEYFAVIDQGHPEFVKARWVDVDVVVEGYLERWSALEIYAAPDAQEDDDESGRGFVDALLEASSPRRR